MGKTSKTMLEECRICGQRGKLNEIQIVRNGYKLAYCTACKTVLTTNRPDLQELGDMYNQLFSHGAYEEHRAMFAAIKAGKPAWGFYHKRILRKIEQLCGGKDLVEIGGGVGAFGVLATSRGWHYVDYDISEVAVGIARQLGLEAYTFRPEEYPPLAPFSTDVLFMWEVIEHVWDVHGYLDVIWQTLRPGGLFVLSTPNYNYMESCPHWGPLSTPPIHCNFFTEQTLGKILQIHGFSLIKIVRKKFYRPRINFRSILFSVRQALALDEPMTLCAVARRDARKS
jgi:2-polyprenyl-3-methyl-5-hydroxy-6-metoxy-1,4-benzoquinol methylase